MDRHNDLLNTILEIARAASQRNYEAPEEDEPWYGWQDQDEQYQQEQLQRMESEANTLENGP